MVFAVYTFIAFKIFTYSTVLTAICWPQMTFDKNNRKAVFILGKPHTKYHICQHSFNFWDIYLLQVFQTLLTSNDFQDPPRMVLSLYIFYFIFTSIHLFVSSQFNYNTKGWLLQRSKYKLDTKSLSWCMEVKQTSMVSGI